MSNTELCSKCGRELKDGELVTGQTWNGDGGAHIVCPETKILMISAPLSMAPEVDYAPADVPTGFVELEAA
jgi:hypothetical protein